MRPQPLHHREDLISLILDRAPTKACVRSIQEGRAIVLGGFTPPGDLSRWVVQVTSRHGRVWFIAMVIDEDAYQFRYEYPTAVNWADWDGRSDGKHPLRDGDDPIAFAFKRMEARRAATH